MATLVATIRFAEHVSQSISNAASGERGGVSPAVQCNLRYHGIRNVTTASPFTLFEEDPLMIRSIALSVATASIFCLLTGPLIAGADCGCEKATGCSNHCCEPCMLVCSAEASTVKVKKHGWELECEHVCIPKVHCPLFSLFGCGSAAPACCHKCGESTCNGNCSANGGCNQFGACGRIRTIRKLKKEEYEVEKCVVEWSIRKCPGSCGKCCNACPPQSSCAPSH